MRSFAQSIVETVRQPLLILDENLRIIAANLLFYQTFGAIPEQTTGESFLNINEHRWSLPRLTTLLESVIRLGSNIENFELDFEAEGHTRTLILDARRISHDDGPRMILLAIEDHSDRQRVRIELLKLNEELEESVAQRTAELEMANRQLRDANRELAATNRELEAFCYSVSHDLRAPLRAVDGFSHELVQSYAPLLDDKAQHYLRRIRSGTQRMGQLIDDLLKLSHVTRADMNREQIDLSAQASSIVAEFTAQDLSRQVTFTAQPALLAWADARLVHIVLQNLLSNAWKFTSHTREAAIEFGQLPGTDVPTFFVRDNGAGFDPAYVSKLFGAFQRLHSDREFPGTGIGLATVQRVILRHGGTTWAEGAVDQGATFYFSIPASEKEPWLPK